MSLVHQLRHSQFKAALVDAQRSREYMPINFENGFEGPDWRMYEKMVMWKMVNMMRQSHDRPFLPFSVIERVEQMAAGHSDYTKKFSLYCSELVDADQVIMP